MTEMYAAPYEPDAEESFYEDYFGFSDVKRWYFPDHRQYIDFQVMNEGQKANFQRKTNRDLVVERNTGNARMKVDQATERHTLLTESVVGWNVFRRTASGEFEPVTFSKGSPGANFEQWLNSTNPKLVEDLEKEIRKANPWLLADMTVEDIDREIANLQEMREATAKREAGEDDSSNK